VIVAASTIIRAPLARYESNDGGVSSLRDFGARRLHHLRAPSGRAINPMTARDAPH